MYGRRLLRSIGVCAIALAGAFALASCTGSTSQETLVITMPENGLIRNADMNYYTKWLEQETGLNLEFNLIPETYGADYLEKVFTSGSIQTDIVFDFPVQEDRFLTYERVALLGQGGYILPLNGYLNEHTQFQKIVDAFPDYDLKAHMTAHDGNLYFFPNIDASARARWSQSLWINRDWLQRIERPLPQTTQELYDTLLAFWSSDPNGDQLVNDIPLGGNDFFDYIISGFVYNDPQNMRLFVQDGTVYFAPVTNEWRRAMQYLNALYRSGILSSFATSLSGRQLTELASCPDNLLGGFTSANITDVIHPTCTESINRFVPLTPIKGPAGTAYATAYIPSPQVGAVISADCKNPQSAFELLDLMLSEEAFLVARYGEEGVDWNWAAPSDLDSYGERAVIKVVHQLSNTPQNQNFAGLGPMYVYPQYADHVTWSGFDPEYLNARAYLMQLQYAPDDILGLICFHGEQQKQLLSLRNELEHYIEETMRAFSTGELDASDDAVWAKYVSGFEQLELERLIEAAQSEYNALVLWRKEREK